MAVVFERVEPERVGDRDDREDRRASTHDATTIALPVTGANLPGPPAISEEAARLPRSRRG